MSIKKIFIICAVIVVCMNIGCGKEGKDITISGSTTMGPLMQKIAESYNQSCDGNVKITVTGSIKGLSLLIERKSDIADSSVKIPAAQLWTAQKKGLAFKEILIGYDIIIPIVHSSNTVGNLFLGQLGDIYSGLIEDWKDVGGKPGKIYVVDRDDDSGTKLVMSERFFESKTVVDGSIKQNCDSNVISIVAQKPAAIGYISKSFYNSNIKMININGFIPTVENIEKKYYPLYREMYLYLNEKSYKGSIKSFIDFILSDKGQEIVRQNGFIPVDRLKK